MFSQIGFLCQEMTSESEMAAPGEKWSE